MVRICCAKKICKAVLFSHWQKCFDIAVYYDVCVWKIPQCGKFVLCYFAVRCGILSCGKKMKYYCSSPFISTRQTAWNKISPCAFGPIEVEVDAGTPQLERWHNPQLQALRQKFLSGEKPIECKRCWDEEDAGVKSLRHRTNEQYGVEHTNWQTGPKELVIKTSNVCNLACRSCGGWDTSYYWPEGKFYEQQYNAIGNDFIQLRDKMYHNCDLWTLDDLVNVEKISFFGGEPLLDKKHATLLKKIIQADRASKTTLFYSTNAQQIGKHYEELWSHFKRVEIFFSVDGIQEQFEYLRWPGNWNKTVSVIDWFLDLPNRYPKVDWYFQGSQCVSLLNIADYNLTSNWLRKKLGAVHFNIVDHPSHYRMTNIPDEHKEELSEMIYDEDIKNYLNIETSNKEDLIKMIVWTKRQDLYRKQNYKTTFPNTFKFIEPLWHKVDDLND